MKRAAWWALVACVFVAGCETDDHKRSAVDAALVATDAPSTPSIVVVPDARPPSEAMADTAVVLECDPVHDPCGAGLRCSWDCTPPLAFRCVADDIGPLTPGERCETASCIRGSECDIVIKFVDAASTSYSACFQFCFKDADCPAGHTCRPVNVVCPGAAQITPYGHCS